jgi:hypothetical protein
MVSSPARGSTSSASLTKPSKPSRLLSLQNTGPPLMPLSEPISAFVSISLKNCSWSAYSGAGISAATACTQGNANRVPSDPSRVAFYDRGEANSRRIGHRGRSALPRAATRRLLCQCGGVGHRRFCATQCRAQVLATCPAVRRKAGGSPHPLPLEENSSPVQRRPSVPGSQKLSLHAWPLRRRCVPRS